MVACRKAFAQANQDLCDQSSPAGLVAGSAATAGVAVKIFMEGNQIAPEGIVVEELAVAEYRPPTFRIKQEDARQPPPQFFSNLICCRSPSSLPILNASP